MIHSSASPVSFLISLLFIIPLIVFWLWMFRDMLDNDKLPGLMASGSLTSNAKSDWTLAFVFLNVFAAVLYYANVYRQRR